MRFVSIESLLNYAMILSAFYMKIFGDKMWVVVFEQFYSFPRVGVTPTQVTDDLYFSTDRQLADEGNQ